MSFQINLFHEDKILSHDGKAILEPDHIFEMEVNSDIVQWETLRNAGLLVSSDTFTQLKFWMMIRSDEGLLHPKDGKVVNIKFWKEDEGYNFRKLS